MQHRVRVDEEFTERVGVHQPFDCRFPSARIARLAMAYGGRKREVEPKGEERGQIRSKRRQGQGVRACDGKDKVCARACVCDCSGV